MFTDYYVNVVLHNYSSNGILITLY